MTQTNTPEYALGFCKSCDKFFDLVNDMVFIDSDEQPVVLDLQLKGAGTERKAINFVKKNHGIDPEDYKDDDGKLHMYYYNHLRTGSFSHGELGEDEHTLTMPKTGHWSFQ